MEGVVTDGPLVGRDPTVCSVCWDEGVRFFCVEGVVTDGPLVGRGPTVCSVCWDEGSVSFVWRV